MIWLMLYFYGDKIKRYWVYIMDFDKEKIEPLVVELINIKEKIDVWLNNFRSADKIKYRQDPGFMFLLNQCCVCAREMQGSPQGLNLKPLFDDFEGFDCGEKEKKIILNFIIKNIFFIKSPVSKTTGSKNAYAYALISHYVDMYNMATLKLVFNEFLEDYEKDLMGFSKKALSSFVFNDDKNQIPLDLSKYEGVRDFVNNFIVRTSNMLDILAVTPAVKNNKTPKDFYIDFNDPNLCDICLSVIKVSELISPLISPRSGAASRYELINDFLKRYPQLIPKLENCVLEYKIKPGHSEKRSAKI